jgi:hypothetical protein
MAEMRAGRAVVELLKAEEVRHVFGIVGATFLDVLDVLYDDKSVGYVRAWPRLRPPVTLRRVSTLQPPGVWIPAALGSRQRWPITEDVA